MGELALFTSFVSSQKEPARIIESLLLEPQRAPELDLDSPILADVISQLEILPFRHHG